MSIPTREQLRTHLDAACEASETRSQRSFGGHGVPSILHQWITGLIRLFYPAGTLLGHSKKLLRLLEWRLIDAASRKELIIYLNLSQLDGLGGRWEVKPIWEPQNLYRELQDELNGHRSAGDFHLPSSLWINNSSNLNVPVHQLISTQRDFEETLQDVRDELEAVPNFRALQSETERQAEIRGWLEDMEAVNRTSREKGPDCSRRFIFVLRKIAGQLPFAPEVIVGRDGKILDEWRKNGILGLLDHPNDRIFHNFAQQSNTSHSLRRRINSRHATRMGVMVSEEEAKDGGRYF